MSVDGVWEISLPTDSNGMISQQCPICKRKFKLDASEYKECDNKYFVCPYCKIKTNTQEFLTEEQNKYLLSIMSREVTRSLLSSLKGLNNSSNSFIKIKVDSKEKTIIPPKEEPVKEIVTCKKCNKRFGLFEETENEICPYCAYSGEGIKVETELVEKIPGEEEKMECKHAAIEREDMHGEIETYHYCDASDRGRSLIGFSEEDLERWCEGCQVFTYENQEGCIHRSYSYFMGMGMKNVQETHLMIKCNEIKGRLSGIEIEKANQICSECEYYISNKAVKYRKVSERAKRKKELIEEGTEYIFTFETTLRPFIESKLTEFYGKDWWKQGVPKDVRDNCEERKQKNKTLYGENKDNILDFADFADYKKIICRKDNWRNIFKPCFKNEKVIDAKLSELEPIRNAIQHNRIVTEREIEKLRIYTDEIIEMIEC